MIDATRFPIDFDALGKGDVIPIERMEHILGARFGTLEYPMLAMQFRERLKSELLKRGKAVSVKYEDGTLLLLRDAEASEYTSRRTHQLLRRAIRHHRELLGVDSSKLTEGERPTHERRLLVDGRLIQSLAQTRAEVRAMVHRRSVPGLPGARGPEERTADVSPVESGREGDVSAAAS